MQPRSLNAVVLVPAGTGRGIQAIESLLEGTTSPTVPQRTEGESEGVASNSADSPASVEAIRRAHERCVPPALVRFRTPKHRVDPVDVSGHHAFVRKLLTGRSAAEAAILVHAADCALEEACAKLELVFAVGVPCVLVLLEDARDTSVVSAVLRSAGFDDAACAFAQYDDVSQAAAALESLLSSNLVNPHSRPLRIPVQDVYKIGGIGIVPVGRVESGTLKPGMRLKFALSGVETEMAQFEMHHGGATTEGVVGDQVGFSLRDSLRMSRDDLRRGDVISDATRDPARPIRLCIAQVVVLSTPLQAGTAVQLRCHTAVVECTITELVHKRSRRTNVVQELNPQALREGDVATVRIVARESVCLEPFREHPALGRFLLRAADGEQLLAIGIVTGECC